jgi:outer membrane protein assembly factor BamB
MMTYRDLFIWTGAVALALAALVIAFAVRVIVRRARAGQRQRWVGLIFRGVLIAGLLALGTGSLINLPPPDLVNRPAPAAPAATVVYALSDRYVQTRTVVGVSARDGSTRWTHEFPEDVALLLHPTPDLTLALVLGDGVYALRDANGATLWHITTAGSFPPGFVTADATRFYMMAPEQAATADSPLDALAYDLGTGAQLWHVRLTGFAIQARMITASDGFVFVAGEIGDPTSPNNPWGVAAFDVLTGVASWFTKGEVIANLQAFDTRLVTARGLVIVAPQDGPLTALRERDGAIMWSGLADLAPPGNPPQVFSIAADTDTVYVVAQPWRWPTDAQGRAIEPPITLLALEAASGSVRWRETISPVSSGWSAMAVNDGVLLLGNSVTPDRGYAGYNPSGSLLTAYDAASGRALWRDNTPRVAISWNMTPLATPLVDGGAVYLLGIQTDPFVQDRFTCVIFCPGVSWLYAVNLHTGAPWWRVRAGYVILSHLVF